MRLKQQPEGYTGRRINRFTDTTYNTMIRLMESVTSTNKNVYIKSADPGMLYSYLTMYLGAEKMNDGIEWHSIESKEIKLHCESQGVARFWVDKLSYLRSEGAIKSYDINNPLIGYTRLGRAITFKSVENNPAWKDTSKTAAKNDPETSGGGALSSSSSIFSTTNIIIAVAAIALIVFFMKRKKNKA